MARALVRIFLDLNEKHNSGLLRESLWTADVLPAFTLLVDNMEPRRRHQDSFDLILNCLYHLLSC